MKYQTSSTPSERKSPTTTSKFSSPETSTSGVSPSFQHFTPTQRRASITFPSSFQHPSSTTSSESYSSHSSNSSYSDFQKLPDDILLTHLLQQGRNHSKIGVCLSILPIIYISTCCCQEKGCFVFLSVALSEIVCHIVINKMRHTTLQSFIRWHLIKLIIVLMAQITNQVYYGALFPAYLLTTFKILIVSKNFCFNIRLMIQVGLILVLGTSAAMFIAYFTQPFPSEKMLLFADPKLQYPLSLNQVRLSIFVRLLGVFVLQFGVLFGGYLFSEALVQTNQEYTRQQVEITREKIKNSEKTKFIANLSHEARNPIHCILGSLQVLSHHFQADKCLHGCEHCMLNNTAISETMQDIKENATLLLHILSSSLQMTSLEMDKIVLRNEEFSIVNLIDSLMGAFSHLAQEKRISLNAFCNVAAIPATLKGDSVRISQIIMNIVSNVIKYTKKGFVRLNCDVVKPDDPELQEIRSSQPEKNNNITYIKLECIDTGCGISQSQMQNLFQPYRIVPTEKDEEISVGFEHYFNTNRIKLDDGGSSVMNTKRTGLGLCISKMLVSKMHGMITVESCPHEGGTVFKIILPLENVTPVQDGKVMNEVEFPPSLKNPSILFIDENEYDSARKAFLQLNENHVQIIPTRFRGSMKQFLENVKCLSKPVRFSDLHELVQNAREFMFSHPNHDMPESVFHHHEKSHSLTHLSAVSSSSAPMDRPEFHHPLDLHHFVTPAENGHHSVAQAPTNSPQVSPPLCVDFNCSNRMRHHSPTVNGHHHQNPPLIPIIPDFSKFSVLIADDNAVNRKVLVKMLQIIGFRDIDTSIDGKECFEKFQQKVYDLVLLDCIMPVLSGKEACSLIRKCEERTASRIPIVAITANTWEVRETLLTQGFDDVLYKPLVLETFRQLLVKLLLNKM
ncbi:hypothetical protein C9374_011671 [Naegleria lovaniensis]|uniref:Histidine kinase n=1 Tax=Naegleria lovaniensis TaxID=51637 RepID=A0AA88GCJ3_NAELO|nr:uncharacterized protein C9374_011671 [Naegleria lovaniensis]KAG2374006.1 hypothetical protein C9374_011671 [Naegleria lovaniensis]